MCGLDKALRALGLVGGCSAAVRVQPGAARASWLPFLAVVLGPSSARPRWVGGLTSDGLSPSCLGFGLLCSVNHFGSRGASIPAVVAPARPLWGKRQCVGDFLPRPRRVCAPCSVRAGARGLPLGAGAALLRVVWTTHPLLPIFSCRLRVVCATHRCTATILSMDELNLHS